MTIGGELRPPVAEVRDPRERAGRATFVGWSWIEDSLFCGRWVGLKVSTVGRGSEPGAFESDCCSWRVLSEVFGGAERGVEMDESEEVFECETKPPPVLVEEYENEDFGMCE